MKERDDMYFPYLRGRQFELIALRELVEKDVCCTLLIGEGKTREIDLRVKDFIEEYSDKANVFDTKDYPYVGIIDQFCIKFTYLKMTNYYNFITYYLDDHLL